MIRSRKVRLDPSIGGRALRAEILYFRRGIPSNRPYSNNIGIIGRN